MLPTIAFDISGEPPSQARIDQARGALDLQVKRLSLHITLIRILASVALVLGLAFLLAAVVTDHVEEDVIIIVGAIVFLFVALIAMPLLQEARFRSRRRIEDERDVLRPITAGYVTTVLELIAANEPLRSYQHAVAALNRDLNIAEVLAMQTWAARQQMEILDAQGERLLETLRTPV